MGKKDFQKLKELLASICNFLPRAVYSNGLILVKLKRDRTYMGYVYFEPAIFPYCYLFTNSENSDCFFFMQLMTLPGNINLLIMLFT